MLKFVPWFLFVYCQQIVAMYTSSSLGSVEEVPEPTPAPQPENNPPRRTSIVVDSSSCLPSSRTKSFPWSRDSDRMSDNTLSTDSLPPVLSVSAPTTFKHAVKVTFNEDLSRFEGLPPEWKFQNQQFGVSIEVASPSLNLISLNRVSKKE